MTRRYSDSTDLLAKTRFERVSGSQGYFGVDAAAEDENVRVGAEDDVDEFEDGVFFQTRVECTNMAQGQCSPA